MKKIAAILALVASAGAYAQSIDNSAHNHAGHHNHGRMIAQVESLTPEQQTEYSEIHEKHRVVMQRSGLDMREIDIKIQKELLAEKPNQKNINKLIDDKAKVQAQMQKDVLKFRLEVKEKFGIEMMGRNGSKKRCKMMVKMSSKGNKKAGRKNIKA